jgi:hypothetical protein
MRKFQGAHYIFVRELYKVLNVFESCRTWEFTVYNEAKKEEKFYRYWCDILTMLEKGKEHVNRLIKERSAGLMTIAYLEGPDPCRNSARTVYRADVAHNGYVRIYTVMDLPYTAENPEPDAVAEPEEAVRR